MPANKSSRYQPMQKLFNIGGVRKIRRLWKRILLSERAGVAHSKD
jgi:hypothetical protein